MAFDICCRYRHGRPFICHEWPITAIDRNAIIRAESSIRRQDENYLRMVKEIDSCDITKDMVFILVMTDANQDSEGRDKAVSKVQTNPKWQKELTRKLESDWATEPFNFLASNDDESKSHFPEAIKTGVLNQSRLIRESVKSVSHQAHLYPEKFSRETEPVRLTVDTFENMGTDYRPAVKELRLALDEPIEFETPVLNCAGILDRRLAKHK